MRRLWISGAAAAALLAAGAAHAAPQTVLFIDVTNPPVLGPGVTAVGQLNGGIIENVGAGVAGYYTGDVIRNTTTSLTTMSLSNLGAHNQISVGFTLAFLDSWDSIDGSPSPDYLNIFLDGVQVLQLTAANASGTVTNLGGGTQVAIGDLFDTPGGPYWNHDRIVDMSTASALTFTHTGSTFVLGLQAGGAGWQGGSDESWGLDNLLIQTDTVGGGVPEPASWALMLLGFGGMGAALRHRRRAAAVPA